MPNIVYVLTNEAMPGLVKIGYTDAESVERRIAELSNPPGIPLPFECYFAAEIAEEEDNRRIERILHQLFSENRINPKREFFKIDPERVVLAISIDGRSKEVTPGAAQIDTDQQKALDKAKARRPNIRLEALGIKTGDVLTFSRDESITAIVVDGGKVDYCGDILSLSAAALKVLHSLKYRTPAASGSEHWKFEGELLDERRRRMESEQFDDSLSKDLD